jgi:Rod binding domain-containing protein
MSILSASGLSSYSSPLSSASASLPPIDSANEPADIRNGNTAAKNAYQEALGFEDVLVQQLTQELASTVTSPGGDSSGGDGSDDSSSDSSGGILGSDPGTSGFASMIPTTLTQSIMSNGGLGIAAQLAQAIDPAIGTPQGEATTSSTAAATTSNQNAGAQ